MDDDWSQVVLKCDKNVTVFSSPTKFEATRWKSADELHNDDVTDLLVTRPLHNTYDYGDTHIFDKLSCEKNIIEPFGERSLVSGINFDVPQEKSENNLDPFFSPEKPPPFQTASTIPNEIILEETKIKPSISRRKEISKSAKRKKTPHFLGNRTMAFKPSEATKRAVEDISARVRIGPIRQMPSTDQSGEAVFSATRQDREKVASTTPELVYSAMEQTALRNGETFEKPTQTNTSSTNKNSKRRIKRPRSQPKNVEEDEEMELADDEDEDNHVDEGEDEDNEEYCLQEQQRKKVRPSATMLPKAKNLQLPELEKLAVANESRRPPQKISETLLSDVVHMSEFLQICSKENNNRKVVASCARQLLQTTLKDNKSQRLVALLFGQKLEQTSEELAANWNESRLIENIDEALSLLGAVFCDKPPVKQLPFSVLEEQRNSRTYVLQVRLKWISAIFEEQLVQKESPIVVLRVVGLSLYSDRVFNYYYEKLIELGNYSVFEPLVRLCRGGALSILIYLAQNCDVTKHSNCGSIVSRLAQDNLMECFKTLEKVLLEKKEHLSSAMIRHCVLCVYECHEVDEISCAIVEYLTSDKRSEDYPVISSLLKLLDAFDNNTATEIVDSFRQLVYAGESGERDWWCQMVKSHGAERAAKLFCDSLQSAHEDSDVATMCVQLESKKTLTSQTAVPIAIRGENLVAVQLPVPIRRRVGDNSRVYLFDGIVDTNCKEKEEDDSKDTNGEENEKGVCLIRFDSEKTPTIEKKTEQEFGKTTDYHIFVRRFDEKTGVLSDGEWLAPYTLGCDSWTDGTFGVGWCSSQPALLERRQFASLAAGIVNTSKSRRSEEIQKLTTILQLHGAQVEEKFVEALIDSIKENNLV